VKGKQRNRFESVWSARTATRFGHDYVGSVEKIRVKSRKRKKDNDSGLFLSSQYRGEMFHPMSSRVEKKEDKQRRKKKVKKCGGSPGHSRSFEPRLFYSDGLDIENSRRSRELQRGKGAREK